MDWVNPPQLFVLLPDEGIIEAIGPGVTDIAVGDPVTAYFYLTCGTCKWCRIDRETLCENFGGYIGRACEGGYAELMKLPSKKDPCHQPTMQARLMRDHRPMRGRMW